MKHNKNTIKLFINNKTDINHSSNSGKTPLMYALIKKHNENMIRLLIKNKTDINKKDKDGYTPLINALKFNNNENIIKLLINDKTDFNHKNNSGKSSLYFLLKNYSEKSIALILSFFYLVNIKKAVNIIKLIINDSNSKYFLENPVFNQNDKFGWNLSNYSFWNKRNGIINYFLIFNH